MNDQDHTFLKSRIKSFKHAFNGVVEVWKEPNFRIHLVLAALAVLLGFVLEIAPGEWFAVVVVIALVLFAELVNTAIERLADVVSPEMDKRIKVVKDVSAAAVLVTALLALVVGLWVFLPKLITIL